MKLSKCLIVFTPLVLLSSCGTNSGFCLLAKSSPRPFFSLEVGKTTTVDIACYQNLNIDVQPKDYGKLSGLDATKNGEGGPAKFALKDFYAHSIAGVPAYATIALTKNGTDALGDNQLKISLPAWAPLKKFEIQFQAAMFTGTDLKNDRQRFDTRINTPTIEPTRAAGLSPAYVVSLRGAPQGVTVTHTTATGAVSTVGEQFLGNFLVGKAETIQINVQAGASLTCGWTCGSVEVLPCNQPISIVGPRTCMYIDPLSPNPTSKLDVATTGSGFGKVSVQQNDVNVCTTSMGTCSLPAGMTTLVANPEPGSTFGGWSGDCSGMDRTVRITLEQDTACTATFTTAPVTMVNLTVELTMPNGVDARIVAQATSIDCGPTGGQCGAQVPSGQPITLEVIGDQVRELEIEWSGPGCASNQASVTVTPTEDIICRARVSLAAAPCDSPDAPTVTLSAVQTGMQLQEVQGEPTLTYELISLRGAVDLSAIGSSSPRGALSYTWTLSDGTPSGASPTLVWDPLRRASVTTGQLIITDQCPSPLSTTLDFVFVSP